MWEAGVPKKFTAHALRMAAASKLLEMGFETSKVMVIGGWTSNSVFNKFYNRQKITKDVSGAFDSGSYQLESESDKSDGSESIDDLSSQDQD